MSGFGTLGWASSSGEHTEYMRDLSQPRGAARSLDPRLDSRLGIQVNANLTEDLSFVGQMVSKYRFDHTFTPDLSWAFLSYAPTSGLQVRVGRLGWDVFQLADTRNVGYSYLWARPPVDFYGPLQISCMDGGDVAWSAAIGDGQSLRFKVSAGRSAEKVPLGGGGINMDLGGGRLIGALSEFQGEALSLRVAYAQFRTAGNFPAPVTDLRNGLDAYATALGDPGLARQSEAMGFKGRLFHYYSAGLGWQEGPFRVDAVGAIVRSGSTLVPSLKSGYVSVGYRTGAVVPYVLVSRIVSEHPEPYVGSLPSLGPDAAALAEGVTRFIVHTRANQSTYSLGLRWDVHPKAAFKAQVDRVSADPGDPLLWPNAEPGWTGKATISSIILDFVF